jgi:hypothetical protein
MSELQSWDVSVTDKTWTRIPVFTDNTKVKTIQETTFSDTLVSDGARLRIAVHFDISTAPCRPNQ